LIFPIAYKGGPHEPTPQLVHSPIHAAILLLSLLLLDNAPKDSQQQKLEKRKDGGMAKTGSEPSRRRVLHCQDFGLANKAAASRKSRFLC